MTEPEPMSRSYSQAELAAFRTISQRIWNQPQRDLRGPPYFACGQWWPTELHRLADEARRFAVALDLASDAMAREIDATAQLTAPQTEPEPTTTESEREA